MEGQPRLQRVLAIATEQQRKENEDERAALPNLFDVDKKLVDLINDKCVADFMDKADSADSARKALGMYFLKHRYPKSKCKLMSDCLVLGPHEYTRENYDWWVDLDEGEELTPQQRRETALDMMDIHRKCHDFEKKLRDAGVKNDHCWWNRYPEAATAGAAAASADAGVKRASGAEAVDAEGEKAGQKRLKSTPTSGAAAAASTNAAATSSTQ